MKAIMNLSNALRIHQSSYKKRFIRNNNVITTPLADGYENVGDTQIEIADILLADEFVIEKIPEVVPNLPNYPESTNPRFSYHDIPGETFANLANDLYNEIVTWKKDLFKLPTGNAAKAFIKELSLWLERFNHKTDHHSISLKVHIILPALMLQKPSKTSKSQEHCKKLEDRQAAWKDGRTDELIQECRTIQRVFSSNERRNKEGKAKTFAKFVFQGKTNAAMKLLTDIEAGVHKVDDTILSELQLKHPQPGPLTSDTLLNGLVNCVLPSYFDEIDETVVFKCTSMTKVVGGSSRLDAEQYRRHLTSNKYKKENKELRVQLATLDRLLATEYPNHNTVEASVRVDSYHSIKILECVL